MVRYIRAEAGRGPYSSNANRYHSGPLVAGVIGKRKFIYDLWGDAVNTAARMESHGIPNMIHMSADKAGVIKDRFSLESRGWLTSRVRVQWKPSCSVRSAIFCQSVVYASCDVLALCTSLVSFAALFWYLPGVITVGPQARPRAGSGAQGVVHGESQSCCQYRAARNRDGRHVLVSNLDPALLHSQRTPRTVLRQTLELAEADALDNRDVLLLAIAAAFHDAGF